MYSYLNKDGEEDNSDNGGEEHISLRKAIVVQQETKREGDSTSQATVGHDELIFGGQLDNAELIDYVGKTNNTWERKNNVYLICDAQSLDPGATNVGICGINKEILGNDSSYIAAV